MTAQAAGKQMIQQGGGSIIATASMSAHIVNVPQPQCAYNASKAGGKTACEILSCRMGAEKTLELIRSARAT